MTLKKTERNSDQAAAKSQLDKRPGDTGTQAHAAPHGTHDADIATWQAQLAEDRSASVKPDEPGSHPVGGMSSANSVTADPFARNKALGAPVEQVTRKI